LANGSPVIAKQILVTYATPIDGNTSDLLMDDLY
jgi:hypothetical protein